MGKKREPEMRSVQFTERDLPGFLDMLRYDGCTVVDWGHGTPLSGGRSTFLVRLRAMPDRWGDDGSGFTNGRWSSFGLTLKEVSL